MRRKHVVVTSTLLSAGHVHQERSRDAECERRRADRGRRFRSRRVHGVALPSGSGGRDGESGAVTLKRVRGGECSIDTYTAGQAFVAYPQDTFIVMNSSATASAEMVVVLFDIPTGGPNRIDRPDPGIC